MMGNQRQVLKDNIEKELIAKIETAKDVITQLNRNLETSKQNSQAAKEEIRTSADVMKDVLVQRKKELIAEVETLHRDQSRSLQDAMKSTYITMGRLQNLLSNLDYYDQSQLVELQIPKVNMLATLQEPTQINVALECNQLKDELREWGVVTTDGFQCCMMEKLMFAKPPASTSSKTGAPAFNVLCSASNKENQQVPTKITAVCESCPWSSWGIENWLSGNKPRKNSAAISENDDFLLVSSPLSESNDMDFVVPEHDNSARLMSGQANDDSDSSIICVEKDAGSERSDLSVWLKPRKSSSSVTSQSSEVPVPLSSDISSFLSSGRRNASLAEKRTLDFPCLRMEADTWIHKKKTKCTGSGSAEKMSPFPLQEQKLMPPAYALPNPFWLKKYQHQR